MQIFFDTLPGSLKDENKFRKKKKNWVRSLKHSNTWTRRFQKQKTKLENRPTLVSTSKN
jgi:uncharacterized protein (UPF0303 family)